MPAVGAMRIFARQALLPRRTAGPTPEHARERPGEGQSEPLLVERDMTTAELVDRNSSGFEHAAILTDLDGDGKDELYVASDRHKEVRRYVWDGKKLAREVIYERPDDRPIFTWNLMPVPIELVPGT